MGDSTFDQLKKAGLANKSRMVGWGDTGTPTNYEWSH
jgi:hypothetical protein